MRILVLILKIVLSLAAAFVAVILVICLAWAAGIMPKQAQPFPSVVVEAPKASVTVTTPSPRTARPALPDRPCTLTTTGIRHVALFPDDVSAQAFHEVVMAADGLRMLDAPGVFEVLVGTRCTVTDLGPKVSRVRIAEGEHSGAAGWITTEWLQLR